MTEGHKGTFVSSILPGQIRRALVYCAHDEERFSSLFYRAVSNSAGIIAEKYDVIIGSFNLKHTDRECSERIRLFQMIDAGMIGGAVFANPGDLSLLKDVKSHGCPVVSIIASSTPGFFKDEVERLSSVAVMDNRSYIDNAVRCIHENGKTKAAVISLDIEDDSFIKRAGENGLDIKSEFTLAVPHFSQTEKIVRLLCALPAGIRPDSIVLTDDNLADSACEGLRKAGVKVPDEILLVSPCNVPAMPHTNSIHVHYFGYDICSILDYCFSLFDKEKVHLGRIKYFEAGEINTNYVGRSE